jgi:Transposase, Mutator family
VEKVQAGEVYYECRDCGKYREPTRTALPILWFWDRKPRWWPGWGASPPDQLVSPNLLTVPAVVWSAGRVPRAGGIESRVASALTWKSTRRYALMASIVPSERLRRELEEIVAGAGGADDPIEAIGRLGARLILQQALEEELTEFLSRERYERRGEPIVYRNGYERATVRTTAGPLELERVGCINPVAGRARLQGDSGTAGRVNWGWREPRSGWGSFFAIRQTFERLHRHSIEALTLRRDSDAAELARQGRASSGDVTHVEFVLTNRFRKPRRQ